MCTNLEPPLFQTVYKTEFKNPVAAEEANKPSCTTKLIRQISIKNNQINLKQGLPVAVKVAQKVPTSVGILLKKS